MSMRFRKGTSQERRTPSTRNRTADLLNSFSSVGLSDAVSETDSEDENTDNRNRRRNRRTPRKKKQTADEEVEKEKQEKQTARAARKQKKEKPIIEDEHDPYDSDPGESYRQHCMKIQGLNTRSCLSMPRFLQRGDFDIEEPASETTSPPSPVGSETDDILNQTPSSLPPDMTRVRYSLRSAVGDGSAKQPTGPSVMDRRELRPNGVALNVSHWSDTGNRAYMEDRYAIEDLGSVQVEVSPINVKNGGDVEVTYAQKRNRRLKMPLSWFGIFDGHGGEKASQYCVDWLSSYVRHDHSFPYDLGYSMKKAFTTIDDDFIATGYPDGTTSCAVSLVGGRRIVCANAGDSRAIIVRKDGSVVRLSRDHKPGMPDETRRITDLGGKVIYWGRWRVEGLLAVSRAIGDASLKPYVTSEPEVCEYDIGKDDWFLVLSSDGVWDVLDNEEAAHVVIATSCVMENGSLVIDTNRFKWAARNLCEHARSCGSSDNFSTIVVDLQSCGNPESLSGRYQPRAKKGSS
mmetsp:Transcript_22687/g.37538  ORF Transcript_22687/g.37538 Transcript_22687/m.37538 type:complete len:516 (-) Transcript_22687:151-1698(-)|eukprot:CAMPEP_0119028664 /NCGR_PEP_ID=MMETSP1176-20130426/39297_1 /TAXON_ID=265551 /ORGANISM="Synedropsis recta cf, Strain CCMP1620" /LENGTH=515 /DNA_ID=CAMNT_0006984857 /DNA_START=387 /DNA_END=1934 /DNA_ORIENTATION=-